MSYTSTVTMKFSVEDWDYYTKEKENQEIRLNELEDALVLVRQNEKDLIHENLVLRSQLNMGSRHSYAVIKEVITEKSNFWNIVKQIWNLRVLLYVKK